MGAIAGGLDTVKRSGWKLELIIPWFEQLKSDIKNFYEADP